MSRFPRVPPWLVAALWSAVILLSLIGVFAAAARSIFVADLAQRGEPARVRLLHSIGKSDPDPKVRQQGLKDFDQPFAEHRVAAWLHVIPGGTFLALAPLQFSSRLRRRFLRLHRWLGRCLVVLGLLTAAPAFYFGVGMPFGGLAEAVPITLFTALFCASIIRAFIAIRMHQVAVHREWMIRAFALAVAVSTVRVFGAVFDVFLATRTHSSAAPIVSSQPHQIEATNSARGSCGGRLSAGGGELRARHHTNYPFTLPIMIPAM